MSSIQSRTYVPKSQRWENKYRWYRSSIQAFKWMKDKAKQVRETTEAKVKRIFEHRSTSDTEDQTSKAKIPRRNRRHAMAQQMISLIFFTGLPYFLPFV